MSYLLFFCPLVIALLILVFRLGSAQENTITDKEHSTTTEDVKSKKVVKNCKIHNFASAAEAKKQLELSKKELHRISIDMQNVK